MNKPCLIFVYNAKSSIFAQALDLVHKTISPQTYQCRLCSLTYSGVSVKKEWIEFLQKTPCLAHFLHKDEFEKQYPGYAAKSYPVVFKIENGELFEFIPADEINKQESLQDLKNLVKNKIVS